jgi:Zinc knuckle/Zinc finger, C2H2 type
MHWKQWNCIFGCPLTFTSQDDLKRHMSETHPGIVKEFDALARASETPLSSTDGAMCPLCQEVLESQQAYVAHVGRHQQDIAIFALPNLPPEFEGDRLETQSEDGEVDSSADSLPDVRESEPLFTRDPETDGEKKPETKDNESDDSLSTSPKKCTYCGETGHISKNCSLLAQSEFRLNLLKLTNEALHRGANAIRRAGDERPENRRQKQRELVAPQSDTEKKYMWRTRRKST